MKLEKNRYEVTNVCTKVLDVWMYLDFSMCDLSLFEYTGNALDCNVKERHNTGKHNLLGGSLVR